MARRSGSPNSGEKKFSSIPRCVCVFWGLRATRRTHARLRRYICLYYTPSREVTTSDGNCHLSLYGEVLPPLIIYYEPWMIVGSSDCTKHPRASGFRGPQIPGLGAQDPLKSGCSRAVEFSVTPKTHNATTRPIDISKNTKNDRCYESPSHEKSKKV